ncbi:CUB domain and C-type lectin domain and C-type lectin-like domain and C-type lectin fold domain-containing protein [Strongyloides ratti]|uniref:CUB domain and C-type lectin domain and C-type lectin-like domain and C-type lectin fold domain-containing protein n=1 Tax=Strongyloides ratti TaxID=34506 RepID=A0A090KZN6_STRRB|nr:CUB domain and C-type lectin domain and C-type lectin-like domain and C-type lectin fold domain-containing protein [Strongyloides ratti]CEF62995.1 CUB domain and C-type lectin domain and C-type lectin-like domain and C-type lectin fold domain-containing protein [Strongyloides ratti]
MNACYYPSKSYYSFPTAQKACQNMNATLTYVKTFIEDEVIKTIVEYTSEHEEFWLGGQRKASDKNFYWLDGTPITNNHFENWMIGYPKNNSGNCVAMKVKNLALNGFVNDNCLNNKKFICAIYNYALLPTENTKSCPQSNYDASTNGSISSPGYPQNYPNDSDCIYSIVAPEGKKIVLTVNFFQTESCCDWLYIHDGKNSNANKIASLRGYVPSGTQFVSSGNAFYIRFTSDQNNSEKGFNIGYESI